MSKNESNLTEMILRLISNEPLSSSLQPDC